MDGSEELDAVTLGYVYKICGQLAQTPPELLRVIKCLIERAEEAEAEVGRLRTAQSAYADYTLSVEKKLTADRNKLADDVRLVVSYCAGRLNETRVG